jgi:nucleotide-binding universal stress UspA family protein
MKFLICTNGSEQAGRALRLGATIAAGCQAEVTLLGIVDSPGGGSDLLDSLKRGQSMLEDKRVHTELISKSGNPTAEIVRQTEQVPYDLVVIGAVRKATRGRFWMSSISYKIVKEIQPPVLIVSGSCTAPKRILICTGGKHYINEGLQLVGQLARVLEAKVSLLHVMPQLPALYARLPQRKETPETLLHSPSQLGQNMREAKASLEALGVAVEVRLREGSVLPEILSEIEQGGYDLTVTGSALSRSLRTYVLGDISREIVNRAGCAVLVVRSRN